MGDAGGEETVEDLRREARKADFRVTRDQLHRWQRAGLLQRPRQRGLGWGRGTETLYLPGSARQVVAICEQLRNKRSLKDAGWGLWWESRWVSEDRIREIFHQTAQAWLGVREGWLSKRKPEFADRLTRGLRQPDPLFTEIGERTGRGFLPTFMHLIVESSLGISPDHRKVADAVDVVADGYGLEDTSDVMRVLRMISQALDPRRLAASLETATLEDLADARDEIREALRQFLAMDEREDNPIIRTWRPFLDALDQSSHEEGSHLVLFWHSVRVSPELQPLYGLSPTPGNGNQNPEDPSNA